jgi:hypothetical protein
VSAGEQQLNLRKRSGNVHSLSTIHGDRAQTSCRLTSFLVDGHVSLFGLRDACTSV